VSFMRTPFSVRSHWPDSQQERTHPFIEDKWMGKPAFLWESRYLIGNSVGSSIGSSISTAIGNAYGNSKGMVGYPIGILQLVSNIGSALCRFGFLQLVLPITFQPPLQDISELSFLHQPTCG
jgi:hypothetical protein